MKKTIIAIFILCFSFVYSEQLIGQRITNTPVAVKNTPNVHHSKTPNDTLMPGNWTNVTPEYILLPAEDGGYVLGTNVWNDRCKCQQYKVTYNYKIEGIIYWFGYKRATTGGLLHFTVWNMNGNTGTTFDTNNQVCPGTPFISIVDSISKIDTSSQLNQAHVVMLPTPLQIFSDFCIGFDMKDAGGDSIALVSTNNGQGGNFELVWEQWSSDNKWYTLQGAQWDSGNINIDAMIMPIIDNTSGCVENDEFLMGIKANSVFPNPCNNYCIIKYQFERAASSASIEILDLSGKRMFFSQDIPTSSQINEIRVNLSNFAAGEYIYILQGDSGKIAKRFSIMK